MNNGFQINLISLAFLTAIGVDGSINRPRWRQVMFDGNYGMNLHTYSSRLKPGTLVIFVSKNTKRVGKVLALSSLLERVAGSIPEK